MKSKYLIHYVIFLLVLLPFSVSSQISQPGIPIQIQKLKSASSGTSDLVVMPAIDNQKMQKLYSRANQNLLKPFRFAHTFNVSLNLKNSGKWYSDGEFNVWQLRIRSTGAYSLNLILENFRLPEQAKLYLISVFTGEIKGAYTSLNNSDSQVFAIEPVEGDEILVQYEEPVKVSFPGNFTITHIAHDFVGVTASGTHRPLGISGACNVNINCDVANGTENVRDAVCRIIIGNEICTGTLVNNTALDGTPYLLTAYHCINTEFKAQSSVFLFNYESPYCVSIDGDVSHSLSGSSLKASFDSLDFSLVRLNNVPPHNFRTYLVGWDKRNVAPQSSICIHHPLGDIKKFAIDWDAALTANFNSSYYPKGFWNIRHWEVGVTEQGSSGGPLFDQNMRLAGTLTGGAATCALPTNDYFEKFALAWDHRTEQSKQLKAWLDPINSNVEKLDGMPLDTGKNICGVYTNFKDNDVYGALQIKSGLTIKGYWSGTNLTGFTEFAEQYKFAKNCEVQGISLGIARKKINPVYPNSYINIHIYEGNETPETLLYTEKFEINNFYNDAMNYLSFKQSVQTIGNFFVSFDISEMNPGDTLAVYMANRTGDMSNSFYLKNPDGWTTYNTQNINGNGSALLFELLACNVDDASIIDENPKVFPEARFFPNPFSQSSGLVIQTVDQIENPEEIAVYDLLGKKVLIPFSILAPNRMKLNFNGQRPGIYLIHLKSAGKSIVGKVAYIP